MQVGGATQKSTPCGVRRAESAKKDGIYKEMPSFLLVSQWGGKSNFYTEKCFNKSLKSFFGEQLYPEKRKNIDIVPEMC